jgi:hypothetical protein
VITRIEALERRLTISYQPAAGSRRLPATVVVLPATVVNRDCADDVVSPS